MCETYKKEIPGMGTLKLAFDEEERAWILTEYEDDQSYENFEDAKEDYDKIVDLETLIEVFDWVDHPYK